MAEHSMVHSRSRWLEVLSGRLPGLCLMCVYTSCGMGLGWRSTLLITMISALKGNEKNNPSHSTGYPCTMITKDRVFHNNYQDRVFHNNNQ